MSALTQQLEQLKQQQQELEKRIGKEEEIKQKLKNESSIERLEALDQPLTDMLERKFKPRSHKEIYGDKVPPMSRQEKMEIWERFWAEKGLKFSSHDLIFEKNR